MNNGEGSKKWDAFFNMPEHSQRIVLRLAEINKTQVWLAEQVEVTPQYISNILVGRSTPSVGLAIKICSLLALDWQMVFEKLVSK